MVPITPYLFHALHVHNIGIPIICRESFFRCFPIIASKIMGTIQKELGHSRAVIISDAIKNRQKYNASVGWGYCSHLLKIIGSLVIFLIRILILLPQFIYIELRPKFTTHIVRVLILVLISVFIFVTIWVPIIIVCHGYSPPAH